MRNRSTSKLVQEVSRDDFFKRFVFWIPLVFTFLVVLGGGAEVLMGVRWFAELLKFLEGKVGSIARWSSKSSSPDETRIIFMFAWVFSLHYAIVVIRWRPYRDKYLRSLVGWRRRVRALPGVVMVAVGLFFLSVPFPVEPNCSRLCIYDSFYVQILYSSAASMFMGYGFALLYWWLEFLIKTNFYQRDVL